MGRKLKVWVEVCCHNCATADFGRFVRGTSIKAREIIRAAEKDGWRQRTSGDFECKKCTKECLAMINDPKAIAELLSQIP